LYAAISMGVNSKMPPPAVFEGAAKFPVSEVAAKKADRLAKRSEGGPTPAGAGCRQSGTVTEAQEQSGASRRRMRRASADPAS
jgi:hypothetical protein